MTNVEMTTMQQIYYKLALLNVFSVINGNGTVNYVKSIVAGCDDLHLDVLARESEWATISLGHFTNKEDELCAEPDMQVRIFTEAKKAQALTFFQSSPQICQKVYPDPDENEMDSELNMRLNTYLNGWLSELINKGHSFVDIKENNMTVKSRVERDLTCDVINLLPPETAIYNGAGWKLARFVNGYLVEMFDPLNQVNAMDDVSAEATLALDAAITWTQQAEGEVWQVMCSCSQLCEPEPFSVLDAQAVANLGRRIGEALAE